MNTLIRKNKPVIKFLAIFLISYITLSLIYTIYLTISDAPDIFTSSVATQTVDCLNYLGYNTTKSLNGDSGFINLFVNGKNFSGIAEGCNAISIMILFIAFIIAFAKGFKKTFLFGLFGIIAIHIMNIVRIIILVICIYHFPKYTHTLHSIIFPALIYSAVFLLWMYWVASFKQTEKTDA